MASSSSLLCFYIRRRDEASAFTVVSVTHTRPLASAKFLRVCILDLQKMVYWAVLVNECEGFAFKNIAQMNTGLIMLSSYHPQFIELNVDIVQHSNEWKALKALHNPLISAHIKFIEKDPLNSCEFYLRRRLCLCRRGFKMTAGRTHSRLGRCGFLKICSMSTS